MNGNGTVWREKQILLLILAILLIANTVYFFTYRVQFEERLRGLDERLAQSETSLRQAQTSRVRAEQQYAAYRKIQKDVQEIYNHRWATQAERLTAMIAEVKRLAIASNLVPPTYRFTRHEARGEGGTRSTAGSRRTSLDATEVGIDFTVKGNYEQVRRLINLLELSDQFVIIEELRLSSAEGGSELTVNLHLKTLFRGSSEPTDASKTL